MSERFGCTLEIGGRINKDVLLHIIKEYPDEISFYEGTLTVRCYDANYGHMTKLEEFLVKNKIPFLGQSEVYFEYIGQMYGYSAEVGVLVPLDCDGNGYPKIDLSEIQRELRELVDMEDISKDDLPLFLAEEGIKKEYAESILKGSVINRPLAYYLNKLDKIGEHYVIPDGLEVEGTTIEKFVELYEEESNNFHSSEKRKAFEEFDKIFE